MTIKKIAVIGLGYIGLPTAAMFASKEVDVVGVDVEQITVDTINRGEIHIVEPDLSEMVKSVVNNGKLRAVTKVEEADAFIIAVPTPLSRKNSTSPEPDLGSVFAAAQALAPVLKSGDLIILESTSPVGTTEKIAEKLSELRPDLEFPKDKTSQPDISLAYCPERVLPGKILTELVQNDRVIGGISHSCSQKAKKMYEIFVSGECILTTPRTAEMSKLTENACRDVQIAFANELSLICDEIDVNVWELIALANRHPRVDILQPGPGVGGHCIAVDPWFIHSRSPQTAKLIHTARVINDEKPAWVVSKVKDAISKIRYNYPEKCAEEITIACFGLSFKADIDDLRESPSLKIAMEIARFHDGRVLAVEPNISVLQNAPHLELVDVVDAENSADIIVILVDHKQFKSIQTNKDQIVIDTKGVL